MNKISKSIKIDEDLYKKIRKIEEKKGKDFSTVVRELIDIALDKNSVPKTEIIEFLTKVQSIIDIEDNKENRAVKRIDKELKKLWDMMNQ